MRKALLLVLALLLIASCGKKVNLFVDCYVIRVQSWGNTFWGDRGGDVLSDPILEELTATINDDTMEIELPGSYNSYQDGRFWDEDTIPQAAGSEQKFDIRTDVGNASATVTVPGEFDITAPLEGDSIPLNADYDIVWEAADGADWYMVLIYYSWVGDDKDTLVYVDSTEWTIPAGWISEDGSMAIYVYAGDGPQIEMGAAGNVNGAKGFCISMNGRANQAVVGAGWSSEPASLKRSRHSMTSDELYRAYLKEMSKYNDDAREMLDYLK